MRKSLGPRTIIYPSPALVIGTYDKNGKPNVMTAAWAGICCSKPPCLAVSVRKSRYSYNSIVERKAFTANVPSEKYVREVDYFGIATGKKNDKFADTHLTPVKSDLVDAPYIEEFPLILECRLTHTIELGMHTQFIGEILDIKADEAIMSNGEPDIEKARPIIYAPENGHYYALGMNIGKAFSIGVHID